MSPCYGYKRRRKWRALDGKHLDTKACCHFNLFFKSSRQTAFFQYDSFRVKLLHHDSFVFAFVVIAEAFARKSLAVGQQA